MLEQAGQARAAGNLHDAIRLEGAAERLQNMALREKAETSTEIPTLPATATPSDIATQRRRSAIRWQGETYLPIWDSVMVALPTIFTRGTLFAATALDEQRRLDDALVADHAGVKLYYTGVQLNQYAANVFATCVDILREFPLNRESSQHQRLSELTFYEFITQHLKLSYNASTHNYVRRCLTHLSKCYLRAILRDGRNLQLPRLLTVHFFEPRENPDEPFAPSGSDRIAICAHEQLAGLFTRNSFVRVHRAALARKSELAAWLLWYYSSQSEPAWLSIDWIREQSGSTASPKTFRKLLDEALEKLTTPAPDGFYVEEYHYTRATKGKAPSLCVKLARYKTTIFED